MEKFNKNEDAKARRFLFRKSPACLGALVLKDWKVLND